LDCDTARHWKAPLVAQSKPNDVHHPRRRFDRVGGNGQSLFTATLGKLTRHEGFELSAHESLLPAVAPIIWSPLEVCVAWRRAKITVSAVLATVAFCTQNTAESIFKRAAAEIAHSSGSEARRPVQVEEKGQATNRTPWNQRVQVVLHRRIRGVLITSEGLSVRWLFCHSATAVVFIVRHVVCNDVLSLVMWTQ